MSVSVSSVAASQETSTPKFCMLIPFHSILSTSPGLHTNLDFITLPPPYVVLKFTHSLYPSQVQIFY
jgi:hypothetical protein